MNGLKGAPEAATVVRQLLGAGFVDAGEIVKGRVALHNLSRSNTVFLVEVEGTRRCLVKKAIASGRADNADMERERSICALFGRTNGSGPPPVPRWLGDIGELMVLEALTPGESLEERQSREGTGPELGRLFGSALGDWRRRAPLIELDLPWGSPWVMSTLDGQPPAFLWDNPPGRQLIERLRSDIWLRDGLADLKRGWMPEVVIHGDIRWNNALLADRGGGEQVVIIDWEFAQMGDPAWDLAGGASEALFGEALIELPADGHYRTIDACDLLDLVKGVGGYLRGLAEGYRGGSTGSAADDVLGRCAPFVAARLVHNAFQHAIWDPQQGMAQALVIAGLASSIFRHPEVLVTALTHVPAAEIRSESPP